MTLTRYTFAGVLTMGLAMTLGLVVASRAAASGQVDDAEPPITGEALTRASAAALAHTGGGRVSEAEIGDEEGAYEVEVILNDGRQVDVHLDTAFQVIGQIVDQAVPEDLDGDGDR